MLTHAAAEGRVVVTLDRHDFIALHAKRPDHAGIVVCTVDPDTERQAARIDTVVRDADLRGRLARVNRAG